MEFRDLKRQYDALKPRLDAAVSDAIAGSRYIMGPQVHELESRLAEYVGAKYCISCANGTDALDIALKVWGIGPSDAVFVPDFTFFSTAEVVALEGAEPVFVDVEEGSFNMDPSDLERAIAEVRAEGRLVPKAVISVDLFGRPADYRRISEIARANGMYLLEDGAQGFGGMLDGRRACSFGDISTTSFFPSKPLGCYGDGGALFTDDAGWAEAASSIRFHGKGSMKYDNVRVGLNSRLDTLQAAILLVKLDAFESFELDAVNEVAKLYADRLCDCADVRIPEIPDGYLSSWAQYTILSSERDALKERLARAGVPSAVYYPRTLSRQKVFDGLKSRNCPVAEELCSKVLSLPIHPYMTPEEVSQVCKTLL